jgi:hypothetical protein
MPENEFEKQVQQLMDNFKVQPSESVWKKVAKRIPKASRRRRFIALLLLFVGLAVCGYFFYSKWNNNNGQLNNFAVIKKTSNNAKHNKDSAETNMGNKTSQQQTDSMQIKEKKQINEDEQKKETSTVEAKKNNDQPESKQIFDLNKNSNSGNDKKDTVVTLLQPMLIDTTNSNAYQIIDDKTGKAKEVTDSGFNKLALEQKIIIILTDTTKNQLLNDTTFTTPIKKQLKKLSANKKWQFGFTALYGRADIVEKIFDANKSYSPQSNDLNGSIGSDTARYYFNASKKVKAKTAFSFGIALKKPISARSSLITGVEYAQLNTQIETGAIKDSAANFQYYKTGAVTSVTSYYKPGNSNTHNNRYRLLQIPLIFEYRLNNSRKLSIDLNAGLILAQLLSSNALVYDAYHQAYYHNDDLFQKTQLHFLTGANMQFALNNKTAVNIGPQFQYGLSDLMRNNTYTNQHFFSCGLKALIFFKK